MKYDYYSSVCNACFGKGWHKKQEKCVRQYTESCKCCGSQEYGKLKTCKGTNVMRDYSNIALQFAQYYDTNIRIKVGFVDGNGKIYETKTGTVAMTSGWKPSFMLMLRSNSRGSSYLLSDNDKIL